MSGLVRELAHMHQNTAADDGKSTQARTPAERPRAPVRRRPAPFRRCRCSEWMPADGASLFGARRRPLLLLAFACWLGQSLAFFEVGLPCCSASRVRARACWAVPPRAERLSRLAAPRVDPLPYIFCRAQAPWDPTAPKPRWLMKWTNPAQSCQAGTKRSAAERDGIPDEQAPPRPSMPVLYKDDNFLVVNKPVSPDTPTHTHTHTHTHTRTHTHTCIYIHTYTCIHTYIHIYIYIYIYIYITWYRTHKHTHPA
jgi:hypothetical protein